MAITNNRMKKRGVFTICSNVAGVLTGKIIYNTNTFNPFYIKEMLVASLILSSFTFLFIAIKQV